MGRVLYCVFKWKKGGLSMRRDARTFGTLFLSTFKLSAFTFGGGYVIIPLMRKQFVDRLGWLEEQEMLDLTAIAQSSMAGQIIGRKRAIPIVTLAGAFIASWFFDVHILLILLACALIGLAQWRSDTKKGAAA